MLNRKFIGNTLLAHKVKIEINDHKSGHIHITIKSPKFKMRVLSSIKSNLTQFERKAVLIHIWKLLNEHVGRESRLEVKILLRCCNYAEVFGTPWANCWMA